MTLTELLAAARLRLDDTATPYGWSDAELTAWLNEAEREAGRRALSLNRTFSVSVVSGTATYSLDSAIWLIERCRLVGAGIRLGSLSRAALDDSFANWESVTGTPRYTMVSGTNLTLYPKPIAADTLEVMAWAAPATLLATGTDQPRIPERDHRALLEWVCYRAGQKRDVDYTLPNPDQYLANFTRWFGPDAGARTARAWAESGTTGTVAMCR